MIPQTGAWSASWTRKHLLGHIPEIWDDRVYFVDKPCENGRQRDWFIELWLDEKIHRFWLSSQSFQTSGTSVTLSGLSPAWNNANNTVEGIGGGASGAQVTRGAIPATGGGGGEYRKISNFSDPGGATPMTIGQGGPAAVGTTGTSNQANGSDGTQTDFNTTSLIAKPGIKGVQGTTPQNGGAGGTGGTGAAGNNDGGRGGNQTANNGDTGGGGAGGPNGAGNAGGDSASGGTATAGGQGDGTSGGTGGAGTTVTPGGAGNPGTELGDSVHGCGGGGGACRASVNAAIVAGSGGLYGAGGGGTTNNGSGGNQNTKATSGAGANGIIVLTWTASTFSGGKLIEILQAITRGSFW